MTKLKNLRFAMDNQQRISGIINFFFMHENGQITDIRFWMLNVG